jgi:hypothetical protein
MINTPRIIIKLVIKMINLYRRGPACNEFLRKSPTLSEVTDLGLKEQFSFSPPLTDGKNVCRAAAINGPVFKLPHWPNNKDSYNILPIVDAELERIFDNPIRHNAPIGCTSLYQNFGFLLHIASDALLFFWYKFQLLQNIRSVDARNERQI